MRRPQGGASAVEMGADEAIAMKEIHGKPEKPRDHTRNSDSTLSARGENGSQKALPVDDDAHFAHLPQHEKDILKKQLDSPSVIISFFGLYRYASTIDILILVVSAICSIAAGAALPLFTVSSPTRQSFWTVN